jgi:hypothetical protein
MMELLPPFIALLVVLVIGFSMIRAVLSGIERRLRALWQIDAKLDLLLRHAHIEFDPYKAVDFIDEALRRGASS